MKVGDLNMHCENCEIIDFCNEYEDTPPCAQLRFENIIVSDYLKAANQVYLLDTETKNDMVDKIYKILEGESE